jgi:hypothetical protein
LLIEFSQAETMQAASDEDVLAVSARLINKNGQAYKHFRYGQSVSCLMLGKIIMQADLSLKMPE